MTKTKNSLSLGKVQDTTTGKYRNPVVGEAGEPVTSGKTAVPAPTTTSPAVTGDRYEYVDTSGAVRTTTGATAEEATENAVNRSPHSGVAISTTTPTDVTGSSGTMRSDEQDLGTKIKTVSAPEYNSPTNYANSQYIRDMEKSLRESLNLEQQNINSSYDRQISETEGKQAGEVGSTSAFLARAGGYLGNSGSGNGVMLSLVQTHRAEISKLESLRQEKLLEARIAYQDKQFDVAKTKLDEAKSYEQEAYKRQQDFFDNTIKASTENRTAENQIRDDARAVITNIISSASGQSFDELDSEAQDVLQQNAKDAGYPLSVIKSLLAAPKAERTKIDSLIRVAVGKGAPAELLDAAASAGSYVEAAKVLAPYLATATGSGNDIKVSYVPQTLQGPVSSVGVSAVYDALIGNSIPSWFAPVITALGESTRQNIDPTSPAAQAAWNDFKSLPDVQTFKKQVDKKIGIPVSADLYGGLSADTSDVNVDE